MAKPTPDEIQKKLDEDEELYGDGEDRLGGSATDPDEDDDMEEAMEDVTGDDFDEDNPKPLNIAEEVDKDEEEIRKMPSPGDIDASEDEDL